MRRGKGWTPRRHGEEGLNRPHRDAHGTAVEVRKNPKSTTWYNAMILDIHGENIRVGFEDGIWPAREVPAYSVRKCPPEGSDEGFDPQVEEVVEVLVSASESNPSGWSVGRVKQKIQDTFFYVGFMGNMRGAQDLIVERSSLRRVNTEASVDTSQLVRRLVPVATALHSWIYTQDAVGCLREVQSTARLFFASCIGREAGDERSPPEVVLVGNERAVELARKLLVQIHFKNQVEMLRFHEHKMRFQ